MIFSTLLTPFTGRGRNNHSSSSWIEYTHLSAVSSLMGSVKSKSDDNVLVGEVERPTKQLDGMNLDIGMREFERSSSVSRAGGPSILAIYISYVGYTHIIFRKGHEDHGIGSRGSLHSRLGGSKEAI